jgi:membrane associated rhomboid family serine protease
MKYLFVLTFILCFSLFDTGIGYTSTSPLWTHITYQFQHAGIFHLLVNSFSFIAMFRLLEKFVNKWMLAAIILSIGFTASFLSMYHTPTLGASAMVYALVGIFFSLINLCRDIRILDKRKFTLFAISVVACLIISATKANSNFFLHLFALMLGAIAGSAIAVFREKQAPVKFR